jgi:hypothetical protein
MSVTVVVHGFQLKNFSYEEQVELDEHNWNRILPQGTKSPRMILFLHISIAVNLNVE